MKRPLLFVVTGFVLGEAIACYTNVIVSLLSVIALGIISLLIGMGIIPIFVAKNVRKCLTKKQLIILFIFYASGTFLSNIEAMKSHTSVVADGEEYVEISGEVFDIEENIYGRVTILDIRNIKYNDVTWRDEGKVRVINITDDVYIGNEILVKGKLTDIEQATNYGQFNSRNYYISKGMYYDMKAEDTKVISDNINIYKYTLKKLKEKIISLYSQLFDEEDAGVLMAMLVGDKSMLSSDIKSLYSNAGISHIIAISGLHLALIGGTIFAFLRRIGVTYVPAAILSVFLIVSYGFLTGLSGATLRAVIMLIISIYGEAIGRTYDILTSMSVAAMIMLGLNVHRLSDSGFLLSFGAIIGISVVYPIIRDYILEKCNRKKRKNIFFNYICKAYDKEFYKKKNIDNEKKIDKICIKILKAVFDGILVSLSIQLVTTPIILNAFYQMPVYSIFLNLIVIPLMSLLILFAFVAGIAGVFYLPFGRIVGEGCSVILSLYEAMCNISTQLPLSSIKTGHIDFQYIILYYFLISVILLLMHFRLFNKFVCTVCIVCVICTSIFYSYNNETLKIVMMDVGQGDGIYIKTPDGNNILVDGGSSSSSSIGKYVIAPTLKYYGAFTLDYIFVSHGDSDHINGIIYLMENKDETNINIKNIVLPNIDGSREYSNVMIEDENYIALLDAAKKYNVNILYMGKGDTYTDGVFTLTCIHPAPTFSSEDRNDYSMVLDMEYEDFNMLFTGDLGEESERYLIDDIKKCDVLKVAHHGSNSSTSNGFLKKLSPKVALISCSMYNNYGHPGKELLNRLYNCNTRTYITKDCGAIKIEVKNHKYNIEGYLDR